MIILVVRHAALKGSAGVEQLFGKYRVIMKKRRSRIISSLVIRLVPCHAEHYHHRLDDVCFRTSVILPGGDYGKCRRGLGASGCAGGGRPRVTGAAKRHPKPSS